MTCLEDRLDIPDDEVDRHWMAIMNLGGDTKVKWDPSNAAEVDNARATFDRLRGQGFTAQTKEGQRMQSFDPAAKSMVMVPAMTAG